MHKPVGIAEIGRIILGCRCQPEWRHSLLQLLELNVLPRCGEGACFFSNSVNLKADVTFGVGFVDFFVAEITNEDSVDPSFDIGSFGDDPEVVPLAVLEVLVRDEFGLWGEPATAGGFAIEVAGFGTIVAAVFGFYLGSVETTSEFALINVFEK